MLLSRRTLRAQKPSSPSRLSIRRSRQPRRGVIVVSDASNMRLPEGVDGPLILVGQARSGSTLLTRLLAETHHFCLVNDAYILQAMDDRGGGNVAAPGQISDIWTYAHEILAARSTADGVATVNRSVFLDAEQLAALRRETAGVATAAANGATTVAAVFAAAAAKSGAAIWGWNSPQDYLHVERLQTLYPRARFVFLIRDPFAVLSSYKSLPAYWGVERNRYHPLIQSLVWRNVVREYARLADRMPDRVSLVRYEDLIARPERVWQTLSRLTGPFPTPPSAAALGRNGSGDARQARPALTRAETWLCARITQAGRRRWGYGDPPAPISGLGVASLLAATLRSGRYYLRRATQSPAVRTQLGRYARHLVGVRSR